MEHALAEKGAPESDAVEPADETPIKAAFDRMGEANIEQLAIKPVDFGVDPGPLASKRGSGAGVDHRVEIAIDDDLEPIGPYGLGQGARHDEVIEGKDRAPLRIDPVKLIVVGALGHREKPDGIGSEQKMRGDRIGGVEARHLFKDSGARTPRHPRAASFFKES